MMYAGEHGRLTAGRVWGGAALSPEVKDIAELVAEAIE
jgi:hypothetical protein